VVAAALNANPTHPINVFNKHTILLSEWKKDKLVDSSVNCTTLKTGDPPKPLSDCIAKAPTTSHNPSDSKLRLDIFDGETVKGFISGSKSDTKLKSLSSKKLDGKDGSMGSNYEIHNFCVNDKNDDNTPTKGEPNILASHKFAEGMLNYQKATSRIKAKIPTSSN
jgi:hypothetical protein